MSVEFSEEAFESSPSQLWSDVNALIDTHQYQLIDQEDKKLRRLLALPMCELSSQFNSILQEAHAVPYGGKNLQGPLYPEINDTLQLTAELLAERSYTPEYLFFPSYMSSDVLRNYTDLSRREKFWLLDLRRTRSNTLNRIAEAETVNRNDTSVSFDAPPFRYQGEHSDYKSSQNCLNACYRMVYEAITNEALPEGLVTKSILGLTNSHLIEDETLFNTLLTDSFREKHGKKVNIWSITGATINTLVEYKDRITQKFPHKQVYAVVNLQSESMDDIWHTNILIDANKDEVVCHDPREDSATPFRRLSRDYFEYRWINAYNRVHLIITDPR